MNRTEKQTEIARLHEDFLKANHAYLLAFSGLTVEQDTALRAKVRSTRSSYKVVKNTLAVRASEGTPIEALREHFSGPTAVAINESDPVGLAKIFKDFRQDNPSFKVKAVVLSGKPAPAEAVEAIASMPTRAELLTQLASAMKQPLQRMAAVLAAPLNKTVFAFAALESKKSS
jgi:ribosomal protein L10